MNRRRQPVPNLSVWPDITFEDVYKYRAGFIIIPIVLAIPLFFGYWKNLYYIFTAAFIGSFFILINFTSFITWLHSKPIYFEDLKVRSDIGEQTVQLYQIIFTAVHMILVSLLIAAIVYFIMYIYSTLSVTASISLIGAGLSIFERIERYSGSLVLNILLYVKKLRNPTASGPHVEITISPSSPQQFDESKV